MLARPVLLLCALLPGATAGVIHGVVLEHASGNPLARTRVRLDMLWGTGRLVTRHTVLTNRSGQFTFPTLENGYYFVSAVRTGFAEVEYGQRRPGGPGMPIAVTADNVVFAEIRLPRFGAITGKVYDENSVGLPGVTVLAYRAALPLRIAASAKSDDRGVYRLAGLLGGRYWVRTAAHELEDRLALLPTFARETTSSGEANVIRVDLDGESPEVHVHPVQGRPVSIRGTISGCPAPMTVTVTLSSDTGRKETRATCPGEYSIGGLTVPGSYELLAETEAPPRLAAFVQATVGDDRQGAGLALRSLPEVQFEREDIPLFARRKDLAGFGDLIALSGRGARLPPGRWQFTARPSASEYLVSISTFYERGRRPESWLDPEWYDVMLRSDFTERLTVQTSPHAATLQGKVTQRDEPVIGAPVYLYAVEQPARRRMNGTRVTRSDARGVYRFEGIAPGKYRVLSSFDFAEVDAEILEEARGATVSLNESEAGTLNVVLYEAP